MHELLIISFEALLLYEWMDGRMDESRRSLYNMREGRALAKSCKAPEIERERALTLSRRLIACAQGDAFILYIYKTQPC